MSEWINNTTKVEVDLEKENLRYILDRIAQMPKIQARRILQYCMEYICDDKSDETLTDKMAIMKKILKEGLVP